MEITDGQFERQLRLYAPVLSLFLSSTHDRGENFSKNLQHGCTGYKRLLSMDVTEGIDACPGCSIAEANPLEFLAEATRTRDLEDVQRLNN